MHQQSEPLRCKSGQILWELLLTVFISTYISVSGFHLLHKVMYRHQQTREKRSQHIQYQHKVDALQYSFDQRCINPFSGIPWLVIRTGPGIDWFPLERLEILTISNGNIVNWEWDAPGMHPVFINRMSREYTSGDLPVGLEIKFPDADLIQFREGIAIEGICQTVRETE